MYTQKRLYMISAESFLSRQVKGGSVGMVVVCMFDIFNLV